MTRKAFAFQEDRMVKMDSRLLVLVTKDQRKAVFARAKKDQTTVSRLVRAALDRYLGTSGEASDAGVPSE